MTRPLHMAQEAIGLLREIRDLLRLQAANPGVPIVDRCDRCGKLFGNCECPEPQA